MYVVQYVIAPMIQFAKNDRSLTPVPYMYIITLIKRLNKVRTNKQTRDKTNKSNGIRNSNQTET